MCGKQAPVAAIEKRDPPVDAPPGKRRAIVRFAGIVGAPDIAEPADVLDAISVAQAVVLPPLA